MQYTEDLELGLASIMGVRKVLEVRTNWKEQAKIIHGLILKQGSDPKKTTKR
jgi:hypothetical protein